MTRSAGNQLAAGLVALGFCALAAGPARSAAADPFPEIGPPDRAAAARAVSERRGVSGHCLTPSLGLLHRNAPIGHAPSTAGAIALLLDARPLPQERTFQIPFGNRIRYTLAPHSADRIDPADGDGDGVPDILNAVVHGLAGASGLLVHELSFPRPSITEILLADLGAVADGYLFEGPDGVVIVLDASPAGGADNMRVTAAHQYAHAVARRIAPFFPLVWDEAFAAWTVLSLDHVPDEETSILFSARLAEMDAGLLEPDLPIAGGNALWLSFLEEFYGRAAVRTTIEELSSGTPPVHALDRALRRVSSDGLRAAFREFHLWTILAGDRADGRHFPFAEQLENPVFASSSDGLPAFSVHADPLLAALGTAQVRIAPGAETGGLRLRFEGDFSARWETDLLLIGASGALRRVAFPLTPEGWGETTVPIEGISEVLLLVRNLGSDDGGAHGYSYSAHLEDGYPFELTSLRAGSVAAPTAGVLVSWETASESGVVGYDILRRRDDGGADTKVNTVSVPALGDETRSTTYHYLDRSAEPGVVYRYRIRGVTSDGLESVSRPMPVTREDSF